jgi:hypothetical protein
MREVWLVCIILLVGTIIIFQLLQPKNDPMALNPSSAVGDVQWATVRCTETLYTTFANAQKAAKSLGDYVASRGTRFTVCSALASNPPACPAVVCPTITCPAQKDCPACNCPPQKDCPACSCPAQKDCPACSCPAQKDCPACNCPACPAQKDCPSVTCPAQKDCPACNCQPQPIEVTVQGNVVPK